MEKPTPGEIPQAAKEMGKTLTDEELEKIAGGDGEEWLNGEQCPYCRGNNTYFRSAEQCHYCSDCMKKFTI